MEVREEETTDLSKVFNGADVVMRWDEVRFIGCTECRRRAISVILKPSKSPLSPGFAPWAILIRSTSECATNEMFTPKRAEANCGSGKSQG